MMRIFPILLAILFFGCAPKEQKWSTVPLPEVHEPVMLTVIYAENPRFEPLDRDELAFLLANARRAAKTHLDTEVHFTLLPPTTVAALFSHLRPEVKKGRQNEIYDFRRGGDAQKLTAAIKKELAQRKSSLQEMIAYAAPYLDETPAEESIEAFAKTLSDTLIERFEMWRNLKAKDGKPTIDASPYNEWTYWDSLGYDPLPFDLVITNTPVASIEYYGQDIHSALRGGLTVGTTTNAKGRPFGGYIFWSTFAFTEDAPLLHRLRGNVSYTRKEALTLSGTYLAHEIGHLLFHYGHPYENSACIMSPVPMLHFRQWNAGLNAEKCQNKHPAAMKKGAATLYYNPAWY